MKQLDPGGDQTRVPDIGEDFPGPKPGSDRAILALARY
jgi:hypothetical protein